jgi:hypothetical protein
MGVGYALPDFHYDIAYGRARGHSSYFLIGQIVSQPNNVENQIWDVIGNKTWATQGEDIFVSSSSVSDTNVVVTVEGVGDDWSEKVATVSLQGRSTVSLANFRVINSAVVSGSLNVGDIYFYRSGGTVTSGVPQDITKIESKILAGAGITHNGYVAIPKGKGFVNLAIRAGTDSTTKISKIRTYVWYENQPPVRTVSYSVTPGFAQYFFPLPVGGRKVLDQFTPLFPEKTIIYATSESATNNTDIFFGADYIVSDLREFGE